MNITYRVVTDIASLEKVVDLEITIWGVRPRDAVPTHLLHTLALHGGVLVVAEVESRLVGLCLGFPARHHRSWYLWSQMTGVHPDFQGQGIGFQLKQVQREWALDNGYNAIRWTYDPLQRGNANFNIRRLGATANLYHINFYGEMTDGINAGLPSDRLEVIWNLKRKTAAGRKKQKTSVDEATIWLTADSNNQPQVRNLDFNLPATFVEIPTGIAQIKREQPQMALDWRLALREVLEAAFEKGYTITDFHSANGHCYYYLTAPQPWFMYVVECADQSLYTGITTDVDQRLTTHNAGKGAAYTAARRPVRLLGVWQYIDRSAALKAEAAFKKQSRSDKLNQITSQTAYHGGMFVKSP